VITYQEERLHDFLEELKPILNNHYDELSVTKSFNLNPDYDRYLKFQDLGSFFIMTCRLDGQLIGYIAYFLYPHIHYKDCMTAMEDLYYVQKEHRQGRVGLKLFSESEKILKDKGVNRIILSCKTHQDHTRLFEHLGYHFYEKHFTKMLG